MKRKIHNRIIYLSLVVLSMISISFLVNYNKFPQKAKGQNKLVGCTYSDLSGEFDPTDNFAFFESKKLEVPALAFDNSITQDNVLGATVEEKWIDVDLSEQRLRAWEGETLFLETPISSGLPWWPTPQGEFRIWIKLRATKMEGGEGDYYYYLPNVPWVMFFENEKIPGWRGFGLHGTYWHDDFGTPRSHGCVNLPNEAAEKLYYWVGPNFENSKSSVARSNDNNQGTRIVIHE